MSAGDDGQSYRERPPRPELGHVLSCVWVQEVSAERTPYEHRTVPNGSAEIACLLDSGALRVTGPRRTSALAALAPGATVVGLRLRPGAASSLLGPASELVDLELGLEAIWGRAAAVLGESLAHAGSAEIAARMLEQELLMRCAGRLEPDPVVARRSGAWSRGGVPGSPAQPPSSSSRPVSSGGASPPRSASGRRRFRGSSASRDSWRSATPGGRAV